MDTSEESVEDDTISIKVKNKNVKEQQKLKRDKHIYELKDKNEVREKNAGSTWLI